jgi:hypothetical protein
VRNVVPHEASPSWPDPAVAKPVRQAQDKQHLDARARTLMRATQLEETLVVSSQPGSQFGRCSHAWTHRSSLTSCMRADGNHMQSTTTPHTFALGVWQFLTIMLVAINWSALGAHVMGLPPRWDYRPSSM